MSLTTAALDAWLPSFDVCTHHERRADAPAEVLWEAARSVRLDQTRTIGRLVRWRIPGVPASHRFLDILAGDPFTVLDEGPDYLISGLAGKIWTLSRDYAHLDGPEAFRAHDEPRTVRVLFAHWVVPARDGGATLFSEARVAPTDRVAALRLRSLWLVVGPFEWLIGSEPLALAAAGAEAAVQAPRAAR